MQRRFDERPAENLETARAELDRHQAPLLDLDVEVLEERIAPAVDYFIKIGS